MEDLWWWNPSIPPILHATSILHQFTMDQGMCVCLRQREEEQEVSCVFFPFFFLSKSTFRLWQIKPLIFHLSRISKFGPLNLANFLIFLWNKVIQPWPKNDYTHFVPSSLFMTSKYIHIQLHIKNKELILLINFTIR
jgi:hypothetical protein